MAVSWSAESVVSPLTLLSSVACGSSALRGRSLLYGGAVTASLPPFHFFASSSHPDSTSAASDAAEPSAWPSSPSTFLPSHLAYSSSPVGLSPLSSPRSGFTSPNLSPGPNIRRLAEQFLNSLPDDSPMAANRSLSSANSGKATTTSSRRAVTTASGTSSTSPLPSPAPVADTMPVTYEPSEDTEGWQRLHDELLRFHEVCLHDQLRNRTLRDSLLARTRWSIRAVWPTAEVDLVGSVAAGVALPKSDLDFVIWFDKTREQPKMYSYTTGPAGGPLPELPFIVVEDEADKASAAEGGGENAPPVLEREDKEVSAGSPLHSSVATASPLSTTSTISNTSTSSSLSRLSHLSSLSSLSSSSSSASSALVSPSNSTSLPPSASTSPSLSTCSVPPLRHYFAHAGALIKLIGGRKKSKLLFRSTKIQVFKDINLIRLRDGCSGVSMDLWFPSERRVVGRSQRHVDEVRRYLTKWRWMGVMAVVVKTFMQQQLLNSGYSGLGSYGVLLMIVRYLQVERKRRRAAQSNTATQTEAADGEADDDGADRGEEEEEESEAESPPSSSSVASGDDEPNAGRVLYGFFRFWAEFDYVNQGVDVRGDGCFIDKPQLKYSQRRPMRTAPNVGGVELDDDEQPTTQSAQQPSVDDDDAASSSTRARRPVASADRLSLVIVDPCDATNHIVCHHKALRNMIAAFIQAAAVLDPSATPIVPATDVMQLADWDDMLPAADRASSAVSATSSTSSSAAASVIGSTASTAPASPLTSKPTSGSATPASTTRTSPTLRPSTTSPLALSPPAALQLATSTASSVQQRSRFHRLIDFNQARLGPSMKLCPAPACQLPDGTSTQCPVQNKVCYTCGHTFIKSSNAAAHFSTVQAQQKDTSHAPEGRSAAITPSTTSRRGRSKLHHSHSASSAAVHVQPSHTAQSTSTYSPPLNKVMANGTIANTNGMKFVHPPAASPAVKLHAPPATAMTAMTAMSHAATAGGFVYVNSPPLPLAVAVPTTPPPFSLSMPVSPYYPPGAVGQAYYGGYEHSFSYAPYAQPSNGGGGVAGGARKRFNGQRGGGRAGMAASRPYAAPMAQPHYYEPTVAGPAAQYMAASGFYPPASPQLPAQPAYCSPAASMPHTMPVGRY